MATIETSPTVPTVYTRQGLNGTWTLDAHLRTTRVQFCLAPGRCSAELARYYGLIDTVPDAAGPALVAPADYSGRQVKIALTRGTAKPVYLYGLITRQTDHPGAPYAADYPVAAGQSKPNGKTVYYVEGWETLLHRYSIQHAYLAAKEETTFADALIATPIVFNSRTRQGTLKGNRSATRNATIGCYLFSDADDAAVWSADQALEYLLVLFNLRHGWQFALDDPAGRALGLESQHASLNSYQDVWDLGGQSYAAAISQLVNPARGFVWFCQGESPAITVLSCVDQPIQLGATTLVPVNNRCYYPALDSATLARDPMISPLDDVYYHQVEAIGDPLRVCFSVGFSGVGAYPGLQKNWLTALETTYNALADDEAAQAAAYDHLYQSFRLAHDWDGTTLNGAAVVNVLLQINDDTCKVDPTKLVENWHRASLLLDRTIPLLQGEQEAGEGSERPPLVLCKNSDGKYYRVDRPLIDDDISPVAVRVLDAEVGFGIHARYPHQYGDGTFAGTFSDFDPEADYRNLIATISLRTQERARALVSTDRPLLDYEVLAVKELSLPGLGLSYIVAGTVKDFTGAALSKSTGEYTRDDSATILAIANLAAAWYGRRRYQVRADYAAAPLLADSGVPYLGAMVADLGWQGATLVARTILSRIVYTFDGDQQTAAWETDFTDFDWRAAYRGTTSSPERQRLDALEDATRRTPVLPAAASPGAAAYDGPFAVSQSIHATNRAVVGNSRTSDAPDFITVHPSRITKTGADTTDLAASGYVYYAIRREDWDGTPVSATLNNAATLPADDTQTLIVPIAYVTIAAGAITAIRQLQYGNIIIDKTSADYLSP